MGGFIVPNTTVHGTVGNPGIPLADSPTGGIYETPGNGVGISLVGIPYSVLERYFYSLGGVPIIKPNFAVIQGSPYAAVGNPQSIALSKDGLMMAVAEYGANTVRMFSINPSTGVVTPLVITPPVLGSCQVLAFSPDGKYLYASGYGTNIYCYIVDKQTGNLTYNGNFVSSVHSGFYDIKFSPDGLFLYASSYGGYIYAFSYNPSNGILTAIAGSPYFNGVGNSLESINISDDGAYLIASDSGHLFFMPET